MRPHELLAELGERAPDELYERERRQLDVFEGSSRGQPGRCGGE